MAIGVFGLRKIYKKQLENLDNNNFLSWPENATSGYFGGGVTFPTTNDVSTVNRLDFSTETILVSNPLPTARNSTTTAASGSTGYFGGGDGSGTLTKINFTTDTTAALPTTSVELRSAAVSSSSYGYFGGGGQPGTLPSNVSTISRLDFSTETITTPTSKLSPVRNFLQAASNNFYGYFCGGNAGDIAKVEDGTSVIRYDIINRLDFSTETVTSPVTKLSTKRAGGAAVTTNSYGYFGGGFGSDTTTVCTIDRLDFSSETRSVPGSQLSEARTFLAGVSDNSYGYFGGGTPATSGVPGVCTINRLDFSTETLSSPGISLSQARQKSGGVSGAIGTRRVGSATYGYFVGGDNHPTSTVCTIDRLDLSTETRTTPTPKLSQARSDLAAVSNGYYSYFGGGDTSTGFSVCTIDRLDFTTESISVPTPKLSQARFGLAAVSSSSYGYFGGGFTPNTAFSTIDRLDFSTETVSVPTPKLSQEKQRLAATSSSSYGYFGGGFVPPNTNYCTIDRLDFSTETISPQSSQLSIARRYLSATSSGSYGYFAGGVDGSTISVCTIDRLDFSTETVSVPTPKLSQARYGLAATSSSSYGYFGGGFVTTDSVCTIDRLDFSTETVSVPTPKLSQTRYELTAVSNTN